MVIAPSSSVRSARRAGRLMVGAALVAFACAGCVSVLVEPVDEMADLPPVVIPTPIPTPSPVFVTDIVIMDLKEEPVADQSLMRLTGIIVNRSKQDAVRLQVRVEARDALGRVMSRVVVPAQSDLVPPGASSGFEASLPRSSAIHDYHAEIVAR
jgi:hypothetical protein